MRWLFIFLLGYSLLTFLACDYSFDLNSPTPCQVENNCNCGDTIIDDRNGQKYGTIWIDTLGGNDPDLPGQCWLTSNMIIGECIDDISSIGPQQVIDDRIIDKACFNFDSSRCSKYGAYYYWKEAVNYDFSSSIKKQGICPKGWHIPSKDEFLLLQKYVNNNNSNLLLDGTNSSGFSLVRSGYVNFVGKFDLQDEAAILWSSTPAEWNGGYAWIMYVTPFEIFVNDSFGLAEKDRTLNCVRCIRD